MTLAALAPAPGAEVGPFRIARPLGAGSSGQLYVARHGRLDHDVALEVIGSPLATDRDFRVRFARTARAMASLESEHVVPVQTFGEDRGCLYLASRLIPDGDLDSLLRTRGAPPLGTAIDLVAQVAAGLADAHRAGLVHGDPRPAQVLLREQPEGLTAYLGGFGAAPAHPAYDVRAMGWVLWATLTGGQPYAGPTPQLGGRSPQELHVNRILQTALTDDPARGYPSAGALRDDLRHALTLPGPSWLVAMPAPRRRRLGRGVALVGGLGVALVLGAGGAVWAGTALRDDRPQVATAPAAPSAATAQDERRAVANIAGAFGGQLFVGPAAATCIAGAWVAAVGLGPLADAGFLDDDMSFYVQDLDTVDPLFGDALDAATAECVG